MKRQKISSQSACCVLFTKCKQITDRPLSSGTDAWCGPRHYTCQRTSGHCAEGSIKQGFNGFVFCAYETWSNTRIWRVTYLRVALPQTSYQFITLIRVQVRWQVRVHAELRGLLYHCGNTEKPQTRGALIEEHLLLTITITVRCIIWWQYIWTASNAARFAFKHSFVYIGICWTSNLRTHTATNGYFLLLICVFSQ